MRAIFSTTAQLLANTLYQKCREGASLNDNFDSPKSGYMVSFPGPGLVFDNVTSVDSLAVAKFIRDEYPKHKTDDDDSAYVGVWKDNETGKVYFDISVNITEEDGGKESALTVARAFKEIAIWDLDNDCEIRV